MGPNCSLSTVQVNATLGSATDSLNMQNMFRLPFEMNPLMKMESNNKRMVRQKEWRTRPVGAVDR